MSAEIQVAALSQSIAALSSMGPRSDERGNMRTGLQREPAGEDLQWGRAQMSAEIRKASPENRARCQSSMGPRSDERGNAKADTGKNRDRGIFNGAALR